MQLLERLAQCRVILATQRIQAGEDEWQCDLVAGEWLGGGARLRCDRVANARVAHALQTGCDVADLAGDQLLHWHVLRSEVAELHWYAGDPGAHHLNWIACLQSPLLHADVVHDALVCVVVGVEDKCAQRRVKWATRCGNARDECLKNFGNADASLRRREDHLFSWNGEGVFKLAHHHLGIGSGEIDLVEHWNDHQAELHRQVHVGERLRLDPLARINDEDGTVTGLQAS